MTTKPPGWVSKTPATTKTKRPASRRPPGLVEHSPAKATRAKSPRRPAAKPPRTTDDAILTQIRLAQLTGSTDDDTKAVSGGTGQLIDVSGGGGSVTKQGVISTGVKATDLDGLAADSLGAPDGAAELDGDGVLSSPLPDSVVNGVSLAETAVQPGAAETLNTVATSGASQTIPDPVSTGKTLSRIVVTADCALEAPTPAEGVSFTVVTVQDATGGHALTWTTPSGAIQWPGGAAPTYSSAPNAIDATTFVCADGTNWMGMPAGYAFA